MKIFVAPLNWGLGHATRCVPIVRRFLSEGHEVVLGGDGDSLVWLRRYFPDLRAVEMAPLHLQYGSGRRQVGAMLRALPQLIRFYVEDMARLGQLLATESFDMVVSDNRFGLWSDRTRCVYITHQLHIRLPKGWHWLEGLASRVHARIYNRYAEVWVPDRPTDGLSGILGHPQGGVHKQTHVKYIGPQSRFAQDAQPVLSTQAPFSVVCLLSGLEPQRTLLEDELLRRFEGQQVSVLVVRGKVKAPYMTITKGTITLVPWLNDNELVSALMGADKIICRSGYSTLMDLDCLGIMHKAELIPTPGQPEQEYLASLWRPSCRPTSPE